MSSYSRSGDHFDGRSFVSASAPASGASGYASPRTITPSTTGGLLAAASRPSASKIWTETSLSSAPGRAVADTFKASFSPSSESHR